MKADEHTLVSEVISELRDCYDPERLEFSKNYYPTDFEVIGNKVPDIKRISSDLKKKLKTIPSDQQLEILTQLIDTKIHECQQVAYIVIASNKKIMGSLNEETLKRLEKGLDNWVSVDFYSTKILGKLWLEGIIDSDLIHEKTSSENVWERRTALVCTVALNLKSAGNELGDPDRTFLITDQLLDDHEDMVVKAMSWALRELGKRNPEIVLEYVEDNETFLAKKVVREVRNRMKTEKK